MKKWLVFLPFLLIIPLSACSSETVPFSNPDNEIVVRLNEREGFDVLSSNPVVIERGQDASFAVRIFDSFEFDDQSEGLLDTQESIYTVKNITRSRNVDLLVRKKGVFTFDVENDENLGNVEIFPRKETYYPGEEITVSVTPKADNGFMCFTKTNPYRPVNHWNPSGKPVSFVSNFSFAITEDTVLFTNYFTKNLLQIQYFANGGSTIDDQESLTLDYFIPVQFKNPTTLLGTHYFSNPGHTLLSYNSKPDGSGTRVGIGSAADISLASENKICLFAQWGEWTNQDSFVFEEEESACSLVRYVGDPNTEVIILPDLFRNKPVTTICSGAFDGINVKSLVFNESLSVVEEGAVANCPALNELTLFTNIVQVSNKSIVSQNLKTIRINQTLYAYNTTKMQRDIAGQIQTLESHGNKAVFFGMSTMRFNHPLDALKSARPNTFFYLAGTQAGCNYKLALDLVEKTMFEGDILFISLLEKCLPEDAGGGETFTYLEYNFDLLVSIDYQSHKGIFFPQFASYVSDALPQQNDNVYYFEQYVGGYDADGMVTWGPSSDDPNNVDPSYQLQHRNYLKENCFSWITSISERNQIDPGRIYLTWSSYNANSVNDEAILKDFEQYALARLPYQPFDSILDNVFPGTYFRANDSIHLSITGGRARIDLWKDLLISKGII